MMDSRNYPPTSSFADALVPPPPPPPAAAAAAAQTAASAAPSPSLSSSPWASYERSSAAAAASSIKQSSSYGASHLDTELLQRQSYISTHQIPTYTTSHHPAGLSGAFDSDVNTSETSIMSFLSAMDSIRSRPRRSNASLIIRRLEEVSLQPVGPPPIEDIDAPGLPSYEQAIAKNGPHDAPPPPYPGSRPGSIRR